MTDTFLFELVTPEMLMMSQEVEYAQVPGEMGMFGVLPGHAPFISAIKPGMLEVTENPNRKTLKLFVTGGFSEVTNERCVILAEEAIDFDLLTESYALERKEQAEKHIRHAKTGTEQEKYKRDLVVAEAMLEALQP